MPISRAGFQQMEIEVPHVDEDGNELTENPTAPTSLSSSDSYTPGADSPSFERFTVNLSPRVLKDQTEKALIREKLDAGGLTPEEMHGLSDENLVLHIRAHHYHNGVDVGEEVANARGLSVGSGRRNKIEDALKRKAKDGDQSVEDLGFDKYQLKAEKEKDDIVARLKSAPGMPKGMRDLLEKQLIEQGYRMPAGLTASERRLLSKENFQQYHGRLKDEAEVNSLFGRTGKKIRVIPEDELRQREFEIESQRESPRASSEGSTNRSSEASVIEPPHDSLSQMSFQEIQDRGQKALVRESLQQQFGLSPQGTHYRIRISFSINMPKSFIKETTLDKMKSIDVVLDKLTYG